MNKIWRFYDAQTGVFQRGYVSLPADEDPSSRTPEGHVATGIEADPFNLRMDIASEQLVPSTPAPITGAMDAPTVRAERDRRMAETIGISLRALRTGQPLPSNWAAYMQALADIPQQPGFPAAVTWPEPPTD